MTTPTELKLIVETLIAPPFSKTWTVIQLHDEITPSNLIQTIVDILNYIDEADPLSLFKKIDLRSDFNEEFVFHMLDFLQMLKFTIQPETAKELLAMDRQCLLKIMHFLLKDLQVHKKRAYLSIFLSIPQVPIDFSADDIIVNLTKEIETLQEEFKQVHKHLEGLKESGTNASTLKKEINQMEEEKHQILGKIARLKKKVESVAKKDQWLEASKNLRVAQNTEIDLAEKLREHKSLSHDTERRFQKINEVLAEVKTIVAASTPDSLFTKMEEETKMNRFLAKETLPKKLETTKVKLKDLNTILHEPAMSERELSKLENEISKINSEISELVEQKMKTNANGDANLQLFRQQAAIIAKKKEATAETLNRETEELKKLKHQLNQSDNENQKMLRGDDFKKYVSELRGKSTLYKRKKSELSGLTVENGILSRTFDILKQQEQELSKKVKDIENENGVTGFHDAQENLEMEKRTLLAPVIQELRNLRQQHTDLETQYQEKKKLHDSALMGIDSEVSNLEQKVSNLKQDKRNFEQKYHLLQIKMKSIDVEQDKVVTEMKAYIGGDEMTELIQKARGFKTYRDYYNRKILELENAQKNLKVSQNLVKEKQGPNMKQIEMFKNLKKLLEIKKKINQKILEGESEDDIIVTQDRMVLV